MSQRTLQAAKKLLRKELKLKLKQMPKEAKIAESKAIAEKLFAMDVYKNCKSLSLYLSMPSEVGTSEILTNVFANQKHCFVPHYVGEVMNMVRLYDQSDYDSLPVTLWNIKQPADDEVRECAVETKHGLDIIIVPGLGFTREGLRLGRGKGYYDNYFRKYTEKFQKKPVTLGLAYKCQLLDTLPADEFDENLDYVITA